MGPLSISYVTLLTIAACIIIMAVLTAFTSRTRLGKAMRAVSEDKGAAQLMGINVNATISLTFAIGSALAAIAGVLYMSAYPTLTPTTGSMPGIKALYRRRVSEASVPFPGPCWAACSLESLRSSPEPTSPPSCKMPSSLRCSSWCCW